MNDIDIEDMRALAAAGTPLPWFTPDGATVDVGTLLDAIETGRQWETIARQALLYTSHRGGCAVWLNPYNKCDCGLPAWRAAFRDLTHRTPTPTDGE